MGVFLIRPDEKQWLQTLTYEKLNNNKIETLEGLMYFISKNTLFFVTHNYHLLKSKNPNQNEVNFSETHLFKDIQSFLKDSCYIENREEILVKMEDYLRKEQALLWKELGDIYYDGEQFDKSLECYRKVLGTEYEDMALCNIGLIFISIGFVNEGLGIIEKAYNIHQSHKIYLVLLQCKITFNHLEELGEIHQLIHEQIAITPDEENLCFLVWFYQYIGDFESSMTSYMQLKKTENRFKLLDYYMIYMLESKQRIAMEHFLKPLIEIDEGTYQRTLCKVYMDLDLYEDALIVLNQSLNHFTSNKINILKARCLSELNRIIESIECMNQVRVHELRDLEIQDYYIMLLKLSKYANQYTKEEEYLRKLIMFWQQKYRNVYTRILYNTKWKVE